jgi:hypothetical protein
MKKIDPMQPKSLLSSPDDGQDFDIVERTVSENGTALDCRFEFMRGEISLGVVEFGDVIVDAALLREQGKEHILAESVTAARNIMHRHSPLCVGDRQILNGEEIAVFDSVMLAVLEAAYEA